MYFQSQSTTNVSHTDTVTEVKKRMCENARWEKVHSVPSCGRKSTTEN